MVVVWTVDFWVNVLVSAFGRGTQLWILARSDAFAFVAAALLITK